MNRPSRPKSRFFCFFVFCQSRDTLFQRSLVSCPVRRDACTRYCDRQRQGVTVQSLFLPYLLRSSYARRSDVNGPAVVLRDVAVLLQVAFHSSLGPSVVLRDVAISPSRVSQLLRFADGKSFPCLARL